MLKEKFGIWSPHRESSSVLAFKAAVSLRPERWVWCNDRRQAGWWVVDAALGISQDLTADLRKEKEGLGTHGVLLARDWIAVGDPVWTFLKLPLQVGIIYRWLDACLHPYPEPQLTLSGQQLKLRRWPNMSRYSSTSNMAGGMNLTVVCATLLKDWVTYETVVSIADNKAALDALLMDAQRDGILEVAPLSMTSVGAAAVPAAEENPTKAEDPKTWSLVRRLINKFK